MTEYVGHCINLRRGGLPVAANEIFLDFAFTEGASAFWVWWMDEGERDFVRWCANNPEFKHVVENTKDERI